MMDRLFHERQEGAFCGKHCIHNFLQKEVFTQDQLIELGVQLDKLEAETEGLTYSQWLTKHKGKSENWDRTGNFSSQVMEKAFGLMRIEMISLTGNDYRAQEARSATREEVGYICNERRGGMKHWFCFRKIKNIWYEFDSMSARPQVMKVVGQHLEKLSNANKISAFEGIYVMASID